MSLFCAVLVLMSRFIILSEPRTGSTYLYSLLNCHAHVSCEGELLNHVYGPRDDPIGDVNRRLSDLSQPVVGFKIFPEDLLYHQLSLIELVRRLDVKWVIVLWRENFLEMYVSLRIAQRTGVWYRLVRSDSQIIISIRFDSRLKIDYNRQLDPHWQLCYSKGLYGLYTVAVTVTEFHS